MADLSHEQRQGIVSTVLASFFLGWAPILGKLAYRAGVTPSFSGTNQPAIFAGVHDTSKGKELGSLPGKPGFEMRSQLRPASGGERRLTSHGCDLG